MHRAGVPLALVLARGDVPRPAAAALPGAAAAGAAAGRRRHRAALHLRPAGPAGAAARGRRHPDRVLDDGGGARPDLRGAAVPGGQPRGRAAHRREPVRGGGRHARRAPHHRAPPGHPAAGAARAGLRAPCCRSPGASASSAPRSPSPAACRASPGPCRWRSTCSARPTPTPPSRCPWCWSWWPSSSSGCPTGARRRPAAGRPHARATVPGRVAAMTFTVEAAVAARGFDVSLEPGARRDGRRARPQRRRQVHAARRDRRACSGPTPAAAELDGGSCSTSAPARPPGLRRTAAASPCWPRSRCCSRT